MLLRFAACEREHEAYFRAQVAGHWLARLVWPWPRPAPPPRAELEAVRTPSAHPTMAASAEHAVAVAAGP